MRTPTQALEAARREVAVDRANLQAKIRPPHPTDGNTDEGIAHVPVTDHSGTGLREKNPAVGDVNGTIGGRVGGPTGLSGDGSGPYSHDVRQNHLGSTRIIHRTDVSKTDPNFAEETYSVASNAALHQFVSKKGVDTLSPRHLRPLNH